MKKYVFTILLSALFIVLSANTVFAQISDSLKTEMKKISDQLYHNGNTTYIQVDAICDGYLTPGKAYTLIYGLGHISINSRELPLAYMEKLRNFYAENYRRFSNSFRVTSDGISLKEIFDPKSDIYAHWEGAMNGVGSGYPGLAEKLDAKKIITHLVAMMLADGIVDTAYYFQIHFDHNRQLTVNDQKIEDKYASKYAAALKVDGFDIVEAIGNIRYDNNYRKHW